MKNLLLPPVEAYRDRSRHVLTFFGNSGDETCGAFWVPSPIDGVKMRVIASSDGGWDHISISRQKRCPNWPEMDHVKRLFFLADEVCFQLHVAESEHLSLHDYCLHIWRPNDGAAIPLPPAWMVAPPKVTA